MVICVSDKYRIHNQRVYVLRALAQTAGQMCNYTQLAGQVGLDSKTAAKYIGVFEQMHLLRRIDVWARNRLNRVVKTPKVQFIDSGLLSTLLDLSPEEAQQDRTRFGNALETFVFAELLKHTTTADGDYQLLYYRDADQYEVDVVIENAAGNLVGVDVKATATVRDSDLRGLRKLSKLAGDQFRMGILLYDGDETLPLGDVGCAPVDPVGRVGRRLRAHSLGCQPLSDRLLSELLTEILILPVSTAVDEASCDN